MDNKFLTRQEKEALLLSSLELEQDEQSLNQLFDQLDDLIHSCQIFENDY